MRLRRLDLIRYGRFTDFSFELPAVQPDFHIVYGPNEAGKSTALAAIEDLLFGVPQFSPYGFLHEYATMRVGAGLENENASLNVVRRKGAKDTLLGVNGLPIAGGEGVLGPFLSGADRAFFVRMFSLDHLRLRIGGQEILEAKDDVGQMLFSAGAGISGLRERLAQLLAEADDLWSRRRAKHRKFYIADDRRAQAQRMLQEQTVTAGEWRRLRRAYETTEGYFAEVDAKIKEKSAERNRLIRIRRVLRDVRNMEDLNNQLAQLGDVTLMAEDAAEKLAECEKRDLETSTRIATLQEQLRHVQDGTNGLKFDRTLIQRARDILQLYEKRIEIRGKKNDLPKRELELDFAEEELSAHARELGWTEPDPAALIERIPSRTSTSVVRSHLNQRGKLEADVSNCFRTLQESLLTLEVLTRKLGELGETADVSRLAVAIKTVREQGDLPGRVRQAKKTLKDAQALAERKLNALDPGGMDEEMLTLLHVPGKAVVQDCRERDRDCRRRLSEVWQRSASIQHDLDVAVAAIDRIERDERVVAVEELDKARSRRDGLWQQAKHTLLQGASIEKGQVAGFEERSKKLAGDFERATAEVDALADQRFDSAEAAGRIAELKRTIGGQQTLLALEKQNETELAEKCRKLEREWKSLWATAPFDPLAAEAMLEWIEARNAAIDAIEKRHDSENALKMLCDEAQEAKNQLLSELGALGVDLYPFEKDGLNAIIEHASREQRLQEDKASRKSSLEENAENVAEDIERRERELQLAKESLKEWGEKWSAALAELGLNADAAPVAVSAQMDIIEQMRETTRRIVSLRDDRIAKIKLDIADFEHAVDALVNEVSADLKGQPAENAVLKMETRLAKAKQIKEILGQKEDEANELTARIAKHENHRQAIAAALFQLKSSAGVESNDALAKAIQQSDQRRVLETERQQVIHKLQKDGDGKSPEELAEECMNADIDKVAASEASIQSELADLLQRHTALAGERSHAREAFRAVGGDDAAARAAADKNEALAEMQDSAKRYARLKTSAILLQWAIDRYRREKQVPLLKRASELFKVITGSSFSRLEVGFNDQDKACLTGVRPNDSVVAVSGMSTGTADQLYLALRVASVEDYLKPTNALPFMADDLFINFDDERAAAGLRLLGHLSQRTQVLFFTHHQHLVELARETLGASVSTVALTGQADIAA